MRVNDQVCVITGAAGGIGRALAERFIAEGASAVVIADIAPHLEATAAEIGAHAISADVSSEDSIRALIEQTEEAFGPIGLFVANAGIAGVSGGAEVPDEEWQRIWDINVMHHVWAARHMIPRWQARGGGYLLTTVSAAGLLSNIGTAPYTTTKHAALGFGEWLSISHAHENIRVSVLCPQAVRTGLINVDDPAAANVVSHGMIEPEDVAETVIAGLETESFHILPHPEVADYLTHKASSIETWLAAMRKLHLRFMK